MTRPRTDLSVSPEIQLSETVSNPAKQTPEINRAPVHRTSDVSIAKARVKADRTVAKAEKARIWPMRAISLGA